MSHIMQQDNAGSEMWSDFPEVPGLEGIFFCLYIDPRTLRCPMRAFGYRKKAAPKEGMKGKPVTSRKVMRGHARDYRQT